ncbi:DUF349 domain-containing protein [Cellulomonas sp. PhB143]|uniref:DUF349 domain-containing protein n=1 Tax=Cellulomonas sp. PhB143 TaxID=2485186 RepID=UPI000F4983BB|nr:DUF349 domain-containing protein [Cellulomonas sp. PhB143]ROS74572.1 uncharacterized protein DUF349 [Cellulomonas sp. PhB143]
MSESTENPTPEAQDADGAAETPLAETQSSEARPTEAQPTEAQPGSPDTGATPAVAPEAQAPEAGTGSPEAPAPEAPTEIPEASATPADTSKAAPAPTPVPRPRPVPTPAAVPRAPRPGAPRPGAAAAGAPAAPAGDVHPVVPDEAAATKAAVAFGRVDDDGTVYVREAAGERSVGQFPGVGADEAMALYVRRYLDLHAKVALFEARLASTDLTVKEIDATLAKLQEETAEPAAVGDLDALREQVERLSATAAGRREQIAAERAAAKAAAVASRTQIVEAAERIAATDPERMQWRPAGEELRALLDGWKEAQRSGPRIDRSSEESLWKRFSHARTAFDRERRHFFAELEQRNASAKSTKEEIVAEAERIASSTDWGPTAGTYRDLMARWKAAGRANRKDDDALWARFRAAQDEFFHARDAANAEIDAAYGENLVVKEELLTQAEALVPVTDLATAKNTLRDIQDRWEEAGKVPRGDLQRVEGRLRAVEKAVRDAEDAQWSRKNPEQQARAEGAAAQLESAIAELEADLSAAQAAGDERRVAEATAALEARRSWLEQIVRAAQDSRG